MLALDIKDGTFREIYSNTFPSIMALDEDANVLVFNSINGKLYSFAEKESIPIKVKLKDFAISEDHPEVIRYVAITYISETPLTLNLYTENSNTVVATLELPIQSVIETYKIAIRYGAQKFTLEIVDEELSTSDTEIDRITITHD